MAPSATGDSGLVAGAWDSVSSAAATAAATGTTPTPGSVATEATGVEGFALGNDGDLIICASDDGSQSAVADRADAGCAHCAAAAAPVAASMCCVPANGLRMDAAGAGVGMAMAVEGHTGGM